MLASVTLYFLWLFMTGFMLAVVVAGGMNQRPRRFAKARNQTVTDKSGENSGA